MYLPIEPPTSDENIQPQTTLGNCSVLVCLIIRVMFPEKRVAHAKQVAPCVWSGYTAV